jgi:hypothetical protein
MKTSKNQLLKDWKSKNNQEKVEKLMKEVTIKENGLDREEAEVEAEEEDNNETYIVCYSSF